MYHIYISVYIGKALVLPCTMSVLSILVTFYFPVTQLAHAFLHVTVRQKHRQTVAVVKMATKAYCYLISTTAY